MFFALDGLDEVLDDAKRRQIADEIEIFSSTFPLVNVVATCRYVGYDQAQLMEFSTFGVVSLQKDNVLQLFDKLVRLDSIERISEVLDRDLFWKEANERASDLIENPLLCTLIIIIYARRRSVPDDRYQIYRECVKLLLLRWDKRRDINPDLPESHRLSDLLMHLAAVVYEDESLGGSLTERQLFDQAKAFFLKEYTYDMENRASKAADELCTYLTNRAWVLHDIGPGRFEFTHRTFLEYFYARNLETRYEQVVELCDFAVASPGISRQIMPAHLALQARCEENSPQATKAACRFRERLQNPDSAEILINTSIFASEFLNYALPKAVSLIELVDEICDLGLSEKSPHAISTLLLNRGPLADDIIRRCLSKLDTLQTMQEIRIMYSAFDLLNANSKPISFRYNLSELLPNLSETLTRNAGRSRFAFWASVSLFGYLDVKAVRKYGIKLWESESTSHRAPNRAPIDVARMIYSFVSPSNILRSRHVSIYRKIEKTAFSKSIGNYDPFRIIQPETARDLLDRFENNDFLLPPDHKEQLVFGRIMLFACEAFACVYNANAIRFLVPKIITLAETNSNFKDELNKWLLGSVFLKNSTGNVAVMIVEQELAS